MWRIFESQAVSFFNLYVLSKLGLVLTTLFVILVYISLHSIKWCYVRSEDAKFYVEVGTKYINGLAPANLNPEHPPLAKYIIGAVCFYGGSWLCKYFPCFIIVLTIIILVMCVYVVRCTDITRCILLSLILVLDVLSLSMNQNLLDIYAQLFTSLTILCVLAFLFFDRRRCLASIASSIFLGMSIASKLSALYPALGILIALFLVLWRRQGFVYALTRLLFICIIASTVFFSTYLMDIVKGGLNLLYSHLSFMLNYMLWRHGYTLPIAVNGILTAFTKLSIWRFAGYADMIIVNGSISSIQITSNVNGVEIDFKPLIGSVVSWPIVLVYTLVYGVRDVVDYLAGRGDEKRFVIAATALSSMLMLLHGNIFWYYWTSIPLAYLYTATRASPKLLVFMAIANGVQLALIELGLLKNLSIVIT